MKPPTTPFDPSLDVPHAEALLHALSGARNAPHGSAQDVEDCLDLLRAHALAALGQRLREHQSRVGPARFVGELIAPLTTRVGDAWLRGELQIFAEHAYADLVENLLRRTLAEEPPPSDRPRVLLSTLPGEPHGLGLLMAAVLLRAAGASCTSLGVQTPVWDLSLAAAAYDSDIVALSFSGGMNPNHVVDGLTELRAKLPPTVVLWAGGGAPVLHRRRIDGVVALADLADIGRCVERWRLDHA